MGANSDFLRFFVRFTRVFECFLIFIGGFKCCIWFSLFFIAFISRINKVLLGVDYLSVRH